MVKRCIGFDIGSSCLRAVQLSRRGDEFHIEKVFTMPTRRTTDSPADIIRTLVRQHTFDRRADIAISMPYDAVFFRNLETDSVGVDKNCKLDNSELEHDFPIAPDEIVTQTCSCHRLSSGKYSLLVVATSKKLLHERLDIISGAKLHPILLDATIFAIYSTAVINHPEIMTEQAIIAYINESYLILAIIQNNNILIVRNIPIISTSDSNIESKQEHITTALAYEVQMTWQKVFGGEIQINSKIYLVAEWDGFSYLESLIKENLNCQIITVNPYAKVKIHSSCSSDDGICIAEGLALRALAPEATTGINFLNADNAGIKPVINLKREFAIFIALTAATFIVLLLGLFMRLSNLETKHTQIKNEIRDIFQRTLPEEKNMVNPLFQFEGKLQLLVKQYTLLGFVSGVCFDPVEFLYSITKSIPSELSIKIDNMLITTGSVRLTGTSQSFDSVYSWQRLLEEKKQYSTVTVQDIRSESESGLIHFTMLVNLTIPENK